MATRQLVRHEPSQPGADLELVDPERLAAASLRVSAGSDALMRLASICSRFGFQLRGVELESLSGREIGPLGEEVQSQVTDLLRDNNVESARALLDRMPSLYLFHVDLRDTASHRILYVNRYGIVDLRAVGAEMDQQAVDAERRLLDAMQKALELGSV